jgi:trypsin-like peptidase
MATQVFSGSASFATNPLMRKGRLLCAAVCGAAVLLGGTAFAQGKFSDVGKRVSRAVVRLDSFDRDGKPIGLGSGFVVNSRGLIVTNYHVIRSAYRVKVTCPGGDVYEVADVVDFDPEKDFAILKAAAFDLPVVDLGNSNQVEILEEVIAIGHPLGLEYTSSTGVISQRRSRDGFSMLQTTAAISPGNSGGPLVNLKGQVIGIVTEQMKQGQNLNFALPINYVRASLESGTQTRFTLAQIAAAQAEEDEAKARSEIASLFTLYEDQYQAYKAVVPKAWKLSKSESWTEDKQAYRITAMVAPESAARAEVNGYLSEGIRVTVRMPPKGKVWTLATATDYAPAFAKGILTANQGFVQTSSSDYKVGPEPARILEFVGQNQNVQEPEKIRYYVLARPECNITIECVSPAGKFKTEEVLFGIFMESFEFNRCPSWKK